MDRIRSRGRTKPPGRAGIRKNRTIEADGNGHEVVPSSRPLTAALLRLFVHLHSRTWDDTFQLEDAKQGPGGLQRAHIGHACYQQNNGTRCLFLIFFHATVPPREFSVMLAGYATLSSIDNADGAGGRER